jgi:hypothetical protein
MAGSLYYGRDFEKVHYIGNDGLPHYEVTSIDGGIDVVSISSWVEILDYCERKGIPRSAWPEYEDGFDIPVVEVIEKGARLTELIERLPASEVAQLYWLERIASYLNNGNVIFFARE